MSILDGLVKSIFSSFTKIKQTEKAYFRGDPIMSDEEYDRNLEELIKKHKEYVRLNGGKDDLGIEITPPTELEKVRDFNQFNEWLNEITNTNQGSFYIEPKYDGINLTLVYRDGKIKEALMRGNRGKRADILSLLEGNNSIPSNIKLKGAVDIQGELIISKADHSNLEKLLETTYKTTRGILVALINSKLETHLKEHAVFKPYNSTINGVTDKTILDFTKLGMNKQIIFKTSMMEINNAFDQIIKKGKDFNSLMLTDGFDLDGFVVTYVSPDKKIQESIALKPRATKTLKATVKNIEWKNKGGRQYCSLIIDPIVIGEKNWSRVYLKDHDLIQNGSVFIGADIKLIYKNDLLQVA